MAETTTAAEQRRLGREKRRESAAGARQPSAANAPRRDPTNGPASLRGSVRERTGETSPRAAAFVGAAVCVVVGLVTARARKNRNDGNVVSGDVSVHLLNRIELLTIRLQVRHTPRAVPSVIDVHRVEADASSRAPSSG